MKIRLKKSIRQVKNRKKGPKVAKYTTFLNHSSGANRACKAAESGSKSARAPSRSKGAAKGVKGGGRHSPLPLLSMVTHPLELHPQECTSLDHLGHAAVVSSSSETPLTQNFHWDTLSARVWHPRWAEKGLRSGVVAPSPHLANTQTLG